MPRQTVNIRDKLAEDSHTDNKVGRRATKREPFKAATERSDAAGREREEAPSTVVAHYKCNSGLSRIRGSWQSDGVERLDGMEAPGAPPLI